VPDPMKECYRIGKDSCVVFVLILNQNRIHFLKAEEEKFSLVFSKEKLSLVITASYST
jgi:hypothetical protein